MLKDKLLSLKETKFCAVGLVMEKMDNETKEAFADVMRSSVGDKTIADALTTEGLKISRESIRLRRVCFTENGSETCQCRKAEMSTKK
jgi:ribosomal protein L9